MRKWGWIVLAGCVWGAWASQAWSTEPTGVPGAEITALLAQADTLYQQRDAESKSVHQAMALYKQILAADPQNYESLWRSARCYWWLGDHAAPDQRIALFDMGKAQAEKAQQAGPDKTQGYYWSGVCLGRAAEERGITNSLFAVNDIAKAMEKTLALDPKDGAAQHVLGVLYRKAPGWPLSRGDMKKSLEYARLAVANRPDVVLHQYGLAKTLASMGKKAEAKTVLEQALALPGPADLQPETQRDKGVAAELLKTLE